MPKKITEQFTIVRLPLREADCAVSAPSAEFLVVRADWRCLGAMHWRYVEALADDEAALESTIQTVRAYAERDQDAWIEDNCPWLGA